MTELTVFVTSAGRRVGLIQCIRDAGTRMGIAVRVIAGDLRPELSAACACADMAFALPRVDDPGYADAIAAIATQQGARLVIPTIDPELLPLAHAEPAFAAQGINVNISAPEVVAIARDKLETARILGRGGVAVPRGHTLGDPEIGSPALPFPLIAKPRGGSSSMGLRLIEDPAELAGLDASMNYLLQQRLSGPEYTVNVFVDREGRLRAVIPHLRIETRAGEVSKGRTERNEEIRATAELLVTALPGARGALCFQCFLTDRGPIVFEINARFGGGYPLAHAAGARFTQWLIEETLSLPSSACDEWKDGLLMLRHDAEIFI